MIPSQIISLARKQSWCTTDIVTSVDAYEFLNIILEDFWKDITDNNVGLGIFTWQYNLVANQDVYNLPLPIANTTVLTSTWGIEQLYKIWVKYATWDTYYTPVSLIYMDWQLKLPDTYIVTQQKAIPTATINSDTISLYPMPTVDITDWLEIIWPKKHFPLSSTTEDVASAMLIPTQWHYILIEGLKYWFYGNMGSNFDDKKLQSFQFYTAEKLKAINQMSDRMQESSQAFVPDLSYWS